MASHAQESNFTQGSIGRQVGILLAKTLPAILFVEAKIVHFLLNCFEAIYSDKNLFAVNISKTLLCCTNEKALSEVLFEEQFIDEGVCLCTQGPERWSVHQRKDQPQTS